MDFNAVIAEGERQRLADGEGHGGIVFNAGEWRVLQAEVARLQRELEAYKRLERIILDRVDSVGDGSQGNEASEILSDWKFSEWQATGVHR